MQDKELLTEHQVWNRYGLSVSWQRRTRRERRGPKFLKLGKMVRYRISDVEAYLLAHEIESNGTLSEVSGDKKAADSQSAAERRVRLEHATTAS